MLAFYLIMFTMVANASRGLQKLQRVEQLERYFSPAVAEAIGSRSGLASNKRRTTALLTGRVRATVMFTDIRGFTRRSERMDPEDVVAMLSEYVDLVTAAVFKHGGSVDKFLGDGVLAVFGAPISQPDNERNALLAAEEIRRNLRELNATRLARSELPITIGTALATGEVVTGTLGRSAQLAYTVIGDTVNLASRLVGIAREGEILVTASTYEPVTDKGPVDGLNFDGPITLRVRGRQEPVTIYASADPEQQAVMPKDMEYTLRRLLTKGTRGPRAEV